MTIHYSGGPGRRWRLMAGVLLGLVLGAWAQDWRQPGWRLEQVVPEGTRLWLAGKELPLTAPQLAALLGLGPDKAVESAWRDAISASTKDGPWVLIVQLREPVQGGTLSLGGTKVAYLPAGTAPPATPDSAAAPWTELAVPARQSAPLLLPLPPETKIGALRLVGWFRKQREASVPVTQLFKGRYYNATPWAIANAESEYTMYPAMSPPVPYPVSSLIRGSHYWKNTGPDRDDITPRAEVSEINPSWVVLTWPAEQEIHALRLRGNLKNLKLYSYLGDAAVNPTLAPAKEWRLVPSELVNSGGVQLVQPKAPFKARAVKLHITETEDGPLVELHALQAVSTLNGPTVPPLPETELPGPVVTVPYQLAEDSLVTLVINDAAGQRVRNLIARTPRAAGEHAEAWDLKDESGGYVDAGDYQVLGLTHQGLTPRYWVTPYPNIANFAPDNAPWLTGHSGTGEWLADHTPSNAVAAFGDRVYIGSGTAEGGVALLEADLQGRKLWGHHNFAAWTGPQRLLAQDGILYVHANMSGTDHIWTVNLASKKDELLYRGVPTETRRQGIRAWAGLPGKLYFAIRGDDTWLDNAFGANEVVLENSQPRLPPKSDKDRYAPDPREDFIRLFRLKGTPPGQRGGLTYLETTHGPEPRQSIVLALKRAVPIGTLVLPMPAQKDLKVRISLHLEKAAWPPDPDDEKQWQRLPTDGLVGWSVIAAPPGTMTRAIRVSFSKGTDDDLALQMAQDDDLNKAIGGGPEAWSGKLEGMRILRRRFADRLAAAKLSVSSGKVTPAGVWDAQRETALSEEEPALLVMEWPKAEQLRGLALVELDAKTAYADIWTGPADQPVDMHSTSHWEQVAKFSPPRRYFYQPDPNNNTLARYLDVMVDFGKLVETRAVRLRVASNWTTKDSGREGLFGVRDDRGGMTLDARRCRLYGLAALKYLGDEAAVDPLITERLEEFDLASKKVTREWPSKSYSDLAAGPNGQLYGVAEKQVWRLNLGTTEPTPVITDVLWPGALAMDRAGRFFVFDWHPTRMNVRVFSPDGKFLREQGTPGGFKVGPWDPARMGKVIDMTVDSQDQLWLVESQYHPKRTTVYDANGKYLREHLDRAIYGGGGVVDPSDRTLLYYGPLEFKLDYATGRSQITHLTWLGNSPAGEQPIIVKGRKYLVTRSSFYGTGLGVVYLYENGLARRVAAMGLADKFPPLQSREFREKLGTTTADTLEFHWSDRNGDQEVQWEEVVFAPRQIRKVGVFDHELGIHGDRVRFEPESFTAAGIPIYRKVTLPLPDGDYYKLNNGTYFTMGNGQRPAAAFDATGKRLWSYKTEGAGVHGFYSAGPLTPNQVVSEFNIIGHGRPAKGDLGEFLVINANSGIWNVWTADGLLAGQIFRDLRDPKSRHWNMKEHSPGMLVPDVTAGQEHFWGNVAVAQDGETYGVYSSTNVFSVEGMGDFKRFSTKLSVSREAIAEGLRTDREQKRLGVYRQARRLLAIRSDAPFAIDGNANDWPENGPEERLSQGGRDFDAKLRLAWDERNLYLLYQVNGLGPFKNSGNDFRQLFKTGGGVDLMLGVNPETPANRKVAGPGDLRLLFMPWEGKPACVLYQPVAPDAPESERHLFATMVFKTEFDRVKLLPEVRVAMRPAESPGNGYTLEAAVPLTSIGLQPSDGLLLKADWGVLRTDDEGHAVLGRYYWSNPATGIISDVAAEAELNPDLWGHVRFQLKVAEASDKIGQPSGTDLRGGSPDGTIDKLLDELGEELR